MGAALGAIVVAAHSRVIAAYMVHECAHSSVFYEPEWNSALGVLMLWVCSCPYVDFVHLKKIHIAHHKDRADTISFDYRAEIRSLPPLVVRAILALEYCFIPIVEVLVHLRTVLYPLGLYPLAPHDPKISFRIKATALVGAAAILALWTVLYSHGGWLALVLHAIAAGLLIHVLSAHDAFQHTYTVLHVKPSSEQMYSMGPGDRTAKYEEENTFSNLISVRFPLCNMLSLNFGYHNAHHVQPMTAWYALPALHAKLYGKEQYINPQVLPFAELLRTWHENRVRRVLEDDYGTVGIGPGRANTFVGSLGVSFLTA